MLIRSTKLRKLLLNVCKKIIARFRNIFKMIVPLLLRNIYTYCLQMHAIRIAMHFWKDYLVCWGKQALWKRSTLQWMHKTDVATRLYLLLEKERSVTIISVFLHTRLLHVCKMFCFTKSILFPIEKHCYLQVSIWLLIFHLRKYWFRQKLISHFELDFENCNRCILEIHTCTVHVFRYHAWS